MLPQSALHKRHNALSYHRVREAVAAGILEFHWIDGKINPADILSKHWSHATAWPMLQPLLYWRQFMSKVEDKKGLGEKKKVKTD